MKRKLIASFFTAFLSLFLVPAKADVLDTNLFAKRCVFTVSGYEGTETLSGFPVLVRLKAASGDAAASPVGFDCIDEDGIRFADADGNLIPHEIDTWNPEGESLVWVKVPTLSGKTTAFTMYYGVSDAASLPAVNPQDVWSDNYGLVLHMNHGGEETEPNMASANNTYNGTISAGCMSEAGYFGSPAIYGGNGNGVTVADTSFPLDDTFSVSGWFKVKTKATSSMIFTKSAGALNASVWQKDGVFFNLEGNNEKVIDWCSHSTQIKAEIPDMTANWNYFTIVQEGTKGTLYLNGKLATATSNTTNPNTGMREVPAVTMPLEFGTRTENTTVFDGWHDEIRVTTNAVRSVDWHTAEYASMTSDSFVTAEAVVVNKDILVMGETNEPAVSINTATIFGNILSLGEGATEVSVTVKYGLSADALTETALSTTFTEAKEFSALITGLTTGKTYHYEITAINNAATPETVTITGSFVPVSTTDFTKAIKITIGGYAGTTALENFPVLIRLPVDSPVYADVQADGSDLRFFDENDNVLPHEIDTWKKNGESLIWVKVPSLSGTTTQITLKYGMKDTSLLAAVDAKGVWSAYDAVYHMNSIENGAVNAASENYPGTLASSVSQLTTGTPFGSPAYTMGSKDGGISTSNLSPKGTVTLSGWFKLSSVEDWSNFFKTGSWGNPGFYVCRNNSNTSVQYTSGQSQLMPSFTNNKDMTKDWIYLTCVIDGTSGKFYESGAEIGSKDSGLTEVTGSQMSLEIGKASFVGWTDEARVTSTALTADWIAAEYATMTSTEFVSFSEVETITSANVLSIAEHGSAEVTANTATISGLVSKLGDGATMATVTIEYGTTEALGTTYTVEGWVVGEKFTATIPGLIADTTYYYQLKAVNNAAVPATATSEEIKSFTTLTAYTMTEPTVSVGVNSATLESTVDIVDTTVTKVTVTLAYGTTDALGTNVTQELSATGVATFALSELGIGQKYYYQITARDSNGVVVSTTVSSFVMEDPTTLSETITETKQNSWLTLTGRIEHLGVGTTTATLLLGTSADAMSVKATISGLTAPQAADGQELTFELKDLAIDTKYYYAIKVENTFSSVTWSNVSATKEVTLTDASTYTWKGGSGDLTNPDNWSVGENDIGAAGFPSAASTVILKPTEDVVVTIPQNLVVGSFNFSVANASITLKGGSITANSLTMDGAQNGKDLILEGCVFNSAVTNPDQINHLVLTDEARFKLNSEIRIGTLTLSNRSIFHNSWGRYGNTATIDTLELGVELTKFKPGKAVIGKVKTLNDLSTVWIKSDGNFQVTDTTSVKLVGGTDTYESKGSKIPIAVNFVGLSDDDDSFQNKTPSPMTLDANGTLQPLSTDTFTTDFESAGEYDNVFISATTVTLTADKTINALHLQHVWPNGGVNSPAVLDLNGHTLTIRSGYLRVAWSCNVKNGNLVIERPTVLFDTADSNEKRMNAQLVTVGMTDPMAALFSNYHYSWGDCVANLTQYANCTGRVYIHHGGTTARTLSTSAPNVVWESRKSSVKLGNFSNHNMTGNFKGFAGVGEVNSEKMNSGVWLGTLTENDTIEAKTLTVGSSGILAPGCEDYMGYRKGVMKIPGGEYNLYGYQKLVFKPGSHLAVTVRPDGDCTSIDATSTWDYKTAITIEGGNLDITEVGNCEIESTWTVISSNVPVTVARRFDSVTESYSVKYNVEVVQADGSTRYECQVTKKSPMTLITVF